MPIRLRPHHLICGLYFRDKGISKVFLKKFKEINDKLKVNSSEECMEVVKGLDDICELCPERKGDICTKDAIVKTRLLDETYLDALDLKEGQKISLKQAKEIIKKHLILAGFQDICKKCPFLEE